MLPILFIILVSAHSLESATVTKKSTGTASAIKFPEDEATNMQPGELSSKFGTDDVPEACKHLTYCTIKPANYPQEKFDEMFKDYKIPLLPTLDVLGNRQGDIDYFDDCGSEVTYEPLYQVREKRSEPWRTVIQVPGKDLVQRVRLETCRDPGSSCFKPLLAASSYDTVCHQTYNTWEVLVQSGNNGSELIKAELPVCCSCKYKQRSFTTRFNIAAAENDSKEKKNKSK